MTGASQDVSRRHRGIPQYGGHRRLHGFVNSIQAEGVVLECKSMGETWEPKRCW
uniref:hypothetical protein n=1 Tax=Dissulfurimicrobium sp. TaxID=2022436 RepID=UPI00404A4E7B